jgi:hypothetical protein
MEFKFIIIGLLDAKKSIAFFIINLKNHIFNQNKCFTAHKNTDFEYV